MIIRRETNAGSNDLNVVYRPCRIDEMLGNSTNKRIITNALKTGKVPHTQLFAGPAGCGKTTAAKIVALGLNCEEKGISPEPCLECNSCTTILEGNSIDVKEINVGQTGGKDYVDSIVRDLPMAPFNNRFKVLIFDEAHELTAAAKDLLLKPTENGYSHVYFIFCTNQPEKLKSKGKKEGDAFLERCSILNFNRINTPLIKDLLQNVCEFEGFGYDKKIIDFIAAECKGVPRNALVWLNQIATEGSWTTEVAQRICSGIELADDPKIRDFCKALTQGNFKVAMQLYEEIDTAAGEGLRIPVAYWFAGCLRNAKRVPEARKFSAILDLVTVPIYEQGKSANPRWFNLIFKITDLVNVAGRKN
jgi:DNA polymerase-3 subunit gamma/tau